MQQTVEQLLGKARGLHARGDLAGAIRQYEAATLAAGHHPVIAFELVSAQIAAGRIEAGLKAARQAVHRHPDHAGGRMLLAQVLAHAGETRLALSELEAARRLEPRMADVPAMQGTLHAMLGEHDFSEKAFRDALALDPEHSGLLTNLGHALKALGRAADACDAYRQALAKEPNSVATLCAYAEGLSQLGRIGEAAKVIEDALARNPGDADLHHALGNLYQDGGRLQEAAEQQEAALRFRPDFADAAYNLGMVEMDLERWDRAVLALRQAVSLDPASQDNHRAYSIALFTKGNLEAALAALAEAKRATGLDDFDMTRAHILRDAGRFDEAAALYRGVLAGRPDAQSSGPRLDLASTLLLAGSLAEGWQEYARRDDRHAKGAGDPRVLADPGQLFSGNLGKPSVFVDIDQGIGDQLFFLRYAAAAVPHCSRLAVLLDPKIRGLVRRAAPPFEVIDDASQAADRAARIWLPDLTLAAPREYPPAFRLSPDPQLVDEVRAELARCGPPPYVGVTWRAGLKVTEAAEDANRYVKDVDPALLGRALAPVAATVIVLQRRMFPNEGDAFVRVLGRNAFDFSGYSGDLERMLALLSVLDDYVTVSNTNVHLLAGLAGARASVLVPAPGEWRWRAPAGESPWFSGMSVYAEDARQGWDSAAFQLQKDLLGRLGTRTPADAKPILQDVRPEQRFTRDRPSPRFRDFVDRQKQAAAGLAEQEQRIRALLTRTGGETFARYVPLGSRDERFDGVVCTEEVFSGCPEEDLEWVAADVFAHARRFVLAIVASRHGPRFWEDLFRPIGRGHPWVEWEVYVSVPDAPGGLTHKRIAGKPRGTGGTDVAKTQQGGVTAP